MSIQNSGHTALPPRAATRVLRRDVSSSLFSFLVLAAVVLVFHPQHLFLVRRLLRFESHDLVVHVGFEHANECHHALHEAAPTGTQAVVLRLVHHFVHGHHRSFHEGILGKTRNLVRIFCKLLFAVFHALHFAVLHTCHVRHFLVLRRGHGLFGTFLTERTVRGRLVTD